MAVLQFAAAVYQVDWFRSFSDGLPTTKALTSVMLFHAALLIATTKWCDPRGRLAPFIVGSVTWWLVMAVLVEGAWHGVFTRLVPESAGPWTAIAGHPSGCTLAAIGLIGLSGLAWAFRAHRLVAWLGVAVVGLALMALVGLALGVPMLYCYYSQTSTGMAIPTALCLLALGVAMGAPSVLRRV